MHSVDDLAQCTSYNSRLVSKEMVPPRLGIDIIY